MHRWFKNLFAILVITFYFLISAFLVLPVIILAGFCFVLAVKYWHQTLRRFSLSIPLLRTVFLIGYCVYASAPWPPLEN